MAGSRKLDIIISGDAKSALAAFTQTEVGAGGLVSKLGGLGPAAALAGVAVGAAAVGIGTALFKVGSDFDEQFDKIRTATGATGDALGGLKDDFKAVVSTVPTDFGSAGDAIAGIAQKLDLTGKPLQTLSEQFLELSRITGTEVKSNMDSGVAALQNWQVAAGDQSGTLDMLFRATQLSGQSFGDLTSELAANGGTFRALGFDMGQATTLLSGLAKGGVDASLVMPALGKAIAAGAKEGKPAQQVYRDLIRDIKEAPDATSAAGIAFDVLGAKAGPKFAELVRSGKFSFDQLGESIADGSATIIGAGKDTQDFGEKWQLIKNRVLVGLEPLATGVFNGIGTAMDKLGPIITNDIMPAFSAIGSFIDRYQPAFVVLAAVIGTTLVGALIAWGVQSTIAAAQAVAGFVATEARAIAAAATQVVQFGLIIAGYVATGIAAAASGVAMAAAWIVGMGPIALVVAAVAGAAALIVTHWDTIVGAAKAAWQWISDNWPLILAILTGPIGVAVLTIVRHWDTIKAGFTAVKTWIGDRIGDIVGFFTGMPGRISKVTSGMWDGIKNAFRSAINFIIRGWNRIQFKIPGFKVGPIGYSGFTLGLPNIPELATGGIISARVGGMLARLGEGRSDEAVIPLSASGLRPLIDGIVDRLRSAGPSSLGNTGVTVLIQIDARGSAGDISEHLLEKIRVGMERIAVRGGLVRAG